MRISIWSRSAIAIASAAIASAALTATPANAATPAGVTRDDVLAAAGAVRADSGDPFDLSESTQRLLRKLALSKCAVDATRGESIIGIFAVTVESGRSADGLTASAIIYTPGVTVVDDGTVRACSFGALAATTVGSTLNGTSNFVGSTTIESRLSGDVFVTPVIIDRTPADDEDDAPPPRLAATGESVHSATTTTTATAWISKTAKQKKAAKKAFLIKFKAAKKAYAKALKKAGNNKHQRSKAQKTYARTVTAAKLTRKQADAKTRTILKNTKVTVTKVPFSVAATIGLP